jgi:hypothetical protein
MTKTQKKIHFGIPYSPKNRTMVPICQLKTGGLRVKVGIGLGADFETVGVDELDKVDCLKCLEEMTRRLRKGGRS